MVCSLNRTLLPFFGTIIATCALGCIPDSPTESKKSGRGDGVTSPALALRGNDTEHPSAVATEFYVPHPSDFRSIYDRDAANKRKQEWDEYFSWVKTFYSGNLLESGWTKRAMAMLEGLRADRVRDELRASLNELSKLLASEWAKDNSVRKIDNSDLLTFGSRFQNAKAKDDGSGSLIRKEISAIRREIESRFKR